MKFMSETKFVIYLYLSFFNTYIFESCNYLRDCSSGWCVCNKSKKSCTGFCRCAYYKNTDLP